MGPNTTPKDITNIAFTAITTNLVSDMEPVLVAMFNHLCNQSFVKNKAHGFPSFPLIMSYQIEENYFENTVRCVVVDKLEKEVIKIGSNITYKFKINGDISCKINGKIVTHRKADQLKHELCSDCSMRTPVCMGILL